MLLLFTPGIIISIVPTATEYECNFSDSGLKGVRR